MMNVSEKRKLLEAIDILVKRPHQSNEVTLGVAMGYFQKLIEEVSLNQIQVVYTVKEENSK